MEDREKERLEVHRIIQSILLPLLWHSADRTVCSGRGCRHYDAFNDGCYLEHLSDRASWTGDGHTLKIFRTK
jgi:hypothetical protein